jgi:hypothetical protein
MGSAGVDPVGRPTGGQAVRFGLGVAVPLAVVALAYGLWWISDRLLYIGPLDRATFGWAVVIPVWLSAPIAAGYAWRRLTARGITMAAIVVGAAVSSITAVLFWQAVAHPDCRAVRAPIDWVLPSLFIGGLIGSGLAASGLLAAALFRRKDPWAAALAGAGAELALLFVAILAATALVLGPNCQRSSI